MTKRLAPRRSFPLLALLASLAPSTGAQRTAPAPAPPAPAPQASDVLAAIDGVVLDLRAGEDGRLVYCTTAGEVGELDPSLPRGSRRVQVSPAGSIPTTQEIRAVTLDLLHRPAVVDASGNVFVLVGPTWVEVYDDLYMILDATDLEVDADGNFLIASSTPSSGQRAVNRVSPDGESWDYLFVRNSPVQLAADPLTGHLLVADESGSGSIRSVDAGNATYPLAMLASGPSFGFESDDDDGDMALEVDGDVYLIDGGQVWVHRRSTAQTTVFASGYGPLHGVAIAVSTSGAGFSLYVAEGESPALLREIPGVQAPAELHPLSYGPVPDTGVKRLSGPSKGIQIQTLAADNDGNVLVGGHLFGADFKILRFDTSTKAVTQVAHQSDGLAGRIMGLAVAADDAIYALTREGIIHKITENPLVVTTVWSDPTDRVQYGFHLALDVDGKFYVADRNGWGTGELLQIAADGSSFVQLTSLGEGRGVAADPAGGGVFVAEWNNTGFAGTVGRYDFLAGTVTDLPGFDRLNYSNWNSDGDLVVDVNGCIATCSEDDWSVVCWDPAEQAVRRIGSSYEKPLSGVEIAPSTPGSGSTTGWSLYVSDWDAMYEIPSFAGPAPDLIQPTAPRLGELTAAIDPRPGRPRDLAGTASGLYVSTSRATIARVDPASGASLPVLGPEHGLAGDLIALEPWGNEGLVALSSTGDLFLVDPLRGTVARRSGLAGYVTGLLLDPSPRRPAWTSFGRRIVLLEGWNLRSVGGGEAHGEAGNPYRFARSADPIRR